MHGDELLSPIRLVEISREFIKTYKNGKVTATGKTLVGIRYLNDLPVTELDSLWLDTAGGAGQDKIYVVQTGAKVVERCLLMATDPGDIVLDPTCGSGTTAKVAEEWGRRWITIDTSRIALSLAKTRITTSLYSSFVLKDSEIGAETEAKITGKVPSQSEFKNRVKLGFVYKRAPRVTLGSIASNTEIDVIWDNYQKI